MSIHDAIERATGIGFGTTDCRTRIGPSWCTTETGRKVGVAVAGPGKLAYAFHLNSRAKAESVQRKATDDMVAAVKGLRTELVRINQRLDEAESAALRREARKQDTWLRRKWSRLTWHLYRRRHALKVAAAEAQTTTIPPR